ncbi:MAG: 2Fe-2S iron-sulfur cluster binding domain-containing protein [Sinobacteraceae bacterium]|nr:2Fe-2S iron-sulfur cluster binding domain-containing protein [Nevskiaceae bacterium]
MLKFHSLRVAEVRPEAEDAVAIAFDVPEELRNEFTGQAGQHVVVRTAINGAEQRRTYSLVSLPGELPLRIVARVHERGLVSRYLANQIEVGQHLDVLPPNGSLILHARAEEAAAGRLYVGFAAGCGITPVLAIAREVLRRHPRNAFILFYGNTGSGRTMCLEDLQALKDQHLERFALHFIMSREPQEAEIYNGRLDAERVREVAQSLFRPAEVSQYFVCGPGDMIETVSGALRALGVAPECIHGEHFRVLADDQAQSDTKPMALSTAPVAPAVTPAAVADPQLAQVTVLMDGRRRSFSMRMNEETILDAAGEAGLELPFSCRAGVCSTCRTKVVRGEVEMAQNYALEDWELEQGYVLACQSRVKSRELELDYDER